jgi:ABC-type phosphate transport system auxiliary subunit
MALIRSSLHKQDLQDWRIRLNNQVESYQSEIGGLRSELMSEMEALKTEFISLRANLQQQMEVTWIAAGKLPEQPQPPLPAQAQPVEAGK